MTDDQPDTGMLFYVRLRHMLRRAVASLPADDVAERVAYCRRTGEHGVTVAGDAGELRFSWGGRPLLVADRAVFAPDAYDRDVVMEMLPAPPDDAAGLEEAGG